jgi:hypothetical protein
MAACFSQFQAEMSKFVHDTPLLDRTTTTTTTTQKTKHKKVKTNNPHLAL